MMRKRSRFLIWIGLFFLIHPIPVQAQDSHYWTHQFGNRARLLGGAVIGSVQDLSAVYYNPGALVLVESPELLLAGRVVDISRFTIDGNGNDALTTDYLSFDLAPSLFAGEIKLDERSRYRIGYSFLTRNSGKFRVRSRIQELEFDLDLPELEVLANDFFGELDLNEYWAGGTWARDLGNNTGFGISMYLAYRSHRAKLNNTTQLLSTEDQGAIAIITNSYQYSHLRVLWKLGIATIINHWQVGMNVTTPGIGLWSSGDHALDRSLVSQIPDDTGNLPTEIAAFYQETDADYRSPWSIGFGAAKRFGGMKLHVSGEWFAPVSAYRILDTEPFEGQSSGETIETAVIQDLNSVFNIATGVEYSLREDLRVYGAFSTDFNGADKKGEDNTAYGEFNLYHLSGGTTFRVGTSEFTAGGTVSFSDAEPLATGTGGLLPEELRISYLRFSFIIGFQLPF